ncbi:MAG: hypothetical protein HY078_14840 [Elusimicrobia bacterium]|nr:hypothetical protein [Elusimicrobiota bacterium]
MESEYSHLENLIQDVSNLDTARMTLRWALERLNVLEKSNRELDAKSRASAETQRAAERRMQDMEETVGARMRLLSDQEGFYKKLEQTVALLSEGKVDLAQLARKELDLDKVRDEMSRAHQKQFEEIERKHLEMVAHWSERLSQAQTYNPEQLSKALETYDQYRRDLEHSYQKRHAELEESARQTEAEQKDRAESLEAGYQAKLQEVEVLRAGLETRVQERLKEIDVVYEARKSQALKELDLQREQLQKDFTERKDLLESETKALEEQLHKDFQTRTSAWYDEQHRRLGDLQHAWSLERERLIEEQKSLQLRLESALSRIQELQDVLAGSDKRNRDEISSWLAEAERTFQLKTQDFLKTQEEARAAFDDRVRELEAEFVRRREKLDAQFQEWKSAREDELERRLASAQQETRFERSRLAQQLQEREVVIREMNDRVQALQHELVAAESTAMAKFSEELRETLNKEMRATLEIRERELSSHLKVVEDHWAKERQELESELGRERERHAELLQNLDRSEAQRHKELGELEAEHRRQLAERDEALAALREQFRDVQDRLARAKSTDEAQALESLRAKLAEEHQSIIDLHVRERDGLHDRLERLQADHVRQREELERAQEKQLSERDGVIAEIRDRLAESEDKLARAQTSEAAQALDELRTQLTAQFSETLKNTEERDRRMRAHMEEQHEHERRELEGQIRAAAENLQVAFLDKLRLEQEFQAKAREAAKIEAEARAKQAGEFAETMKQVEVREQRQKEMLLQQFDHERKELEQQLRQGNENLQVAYLEKIRLEQAFEAKSRESSKIEAEARAKQTVEFAGTLKAAEEREQRQRAMLADQFEHERKELEEQIRRGNENLQVAYLERIRLEQAFEAKTRESSKVEAALREKTEELADANDRSSRREAELGKAIELQDSAVAKLRERLQGAEEELGRAKASEEDSVRRMQRELSSLREEMEFKALALADAEKKQKELDAEFTQKRLMIEREKQERAAEQDAVIGELRQRLQKSEDELMRSRSTERETALDELRAKLKAEFDLSLKAREEKENEHIRNFEAGWAAEREKLNRRVEKSATAVRTAQEELIRAEAAAQDKLKAAEEFRLQCLAQADAAGRKAEVEHANRLRQTESLVADLKTKLQTVGDQLVRARSMELETALDALRKELEAEFGKAVKNKDLHIAQRDAVLAELTERIRTTEEQLSRARTTDEAAALEALRLRMAAEFEATFRAKDEKAAEQASALNLQLTEARRTFEASIGELRAQLARTQDQLSQARTVEKTQAVDAAQAAAKVQFEERLQGERAESAKRLQDAARANEDALARLRELDAKHARLAAESEQALAALREKLEDAQGEIGRSRSSAERLNADDQRHRRREMELEKLVAELKDRLAVVRREHEESHAKQLGDREAIVDELKQKLHGVEVELARARSVDKAAALEGLRAQLVAEFDARLARERSELTRQVEEAKQAVREREAQAASALAAAQKEAIAGAEALKERMSAEFAALLKTEKADEAARTAALEAQIKAGAEAQERLRRDVAHLHAQAEASRRELEAGFLAKLAERDKAAAELLERAAALRTELANARSTEKSQALDALKTELAGKFQAETERRQAELDQVRGELLELVKSKESQWQKSASELILREGEIQALGRSLEQSKEQLAAAEKRLAESQDKTLAIRDEAAAAAQERAKENQLARQARDAEIKELKEKLRAMEESHRKHLEAVAERFEQQYSARKQELLTAFEGYRKELEAREASIRAREGGAS